MATIVARKFFAQVVSITGGTAISLAELLRDNGWGFVPDANNNATLQRSTDSFQADTAFITPLGETLYTGYNRFVRNAAAAGPPRVYQGAPTAINVKLDLGSRGASIIDAGHVWLYSVNTQDLAIIWGGF